MGSVTYNYLGKSGLKVSNICLGTMTFGEHPQGRPGCDEKEAHAIMDRFIELGGNFIDTADMYQNGLSETIVGNWLKTKERSSIILATKCGKLKDANDPNTLGASRHNILTCVQNSLKRLQTDYIDIFYVHVWDSGTPVEETLSTLNDLVRAGKIHYIAMSNTKGWQLQKMVEISKQRGWDSIIALQQQYSLLCRSVEWEVSEVCRNEGISLLPWSPLKGGWLSGKIRRGMSAPEPESRVGWSAGRAHHSHPDWAWFSSNEQAWGILDKVEEITNQTGKTVAQVALRWLLQKYEVPSVVIGVRTMAQFEDNIGAAAGWSLTQEQISILDEASAIPAPYPYDYIAKDNIARTRQNNNN